MDIQQNNVAVLHFNLVNQDGSTIFIRKTKLATFNLINPSEVSVPITDIGFDATLNQCWVRIPKESNATTGQYYGVLNIVDDDWGTYTTSKIKVYSVVSDSDADTKSVVFTATCIATQVTNPSGGNSPYYNTTTGTWWQYSDTLKAFEDTGVGNLIKYITKNVQHLKDGTGNGSVVTCLDDEISANNTATGLCSTDLGKNNVNSGESCVALGENNYIAEGVSNATAIAGARPSLVDVFAIGDKTAGNKNIFTINKFGDISFRPDSSQERTAVLQDILDHVIKNVFYDSSNYSLTVTFYSSSDNANKTKTYDLSGLKAVLKDDAVKEISVNQETAVMTVDTINGSSQQIQLPTGVKSIVRICQEASPVCFDTVTDQGGTTTTLYSPALFMKEPQTSLVLNNVNTGNSDGQTEYFKWFYDQHHITEGASYAINTFFNLPIDFATKPDCTPFDSSHVIVPTLSCMNGALASCLPLAGGTLTGDLLFFGSGTDNRGIYGTVGQSAAWRLVGGASAPKSGWLELATADDGTKPIYVRQYGDWYTTITHSATLLDESGNTSFPGTVTASAFLGNATSATKATQDGSGNVIADTYDTVTSVDSKLALYQKKLMFYNGAGKYNQQSGSEVELVGHRTAENGIILGDYDPNASVPQLASGEHSMAFGARNQATAAYAVGIGTTNTVSATYAFGVGYLNTVAAINAYVMGSSNNVGTSAGYSMVVGHANTANGSFSKIFGDECVSNGTNSTLVGYGLKSNADYQFVIGKYNDNSSDHILEIGFGQSDTQRSNLLYVDYDGDLHCKGDVYYKKSVSTADISSGVLNISSLTKFINISTSNVTITSINNTATGYSAGDEITLYGTFTYNVDGASFKVTDGALKIVYTGTKFVRLY